MRSEVEQMRAYVAVLEQYLDEAEGKTDEERVRAGGANGEARV